MVLCSRLGLVKLLVQEVTHSCGWIWMGLQTSVTVGVSVAIEVFHRYRWMLYLCCVSDACSEEDLDGSGQTAVRTDVPPKMRSGFITCCYQTQHWSQGQKLLNSRLNTEVSNENFGKPNSYKQSWARGKIIPCLSSLEPTEEFFSEEREGSSLSAW